ncbi:MAG TPA: hypothetical protein VGD87_10530, partial [Archangium sp.]
MPRFNSWRGGGVMQNRLIMGVAVAWAPLAMGQVTITAPFETGPTPTGLSPPTLSGGSNCSKTDWRIALKGGRAGDVYEIVESAGNPNLPFPQGYSQP